MSTVRRTSALTLTIVGAVGLTGGRLVRPVVERRDGIAPTVGWSASLALAIGAVILAGLAWNTFQNLHRRKLRMTSNYGVGMLALAKSSAIVGALVLGGYLGYAIGFADAWDTPRGRERVIHSLAAAGAALLMMAAALFLERSCEVPGDEDDDDGNGGKSGTADASPA